MIVIADASPLRYLIVIGYPHLLATMFGEVWAPQAVIDELSSKRLAPSAT